MSLADGVLPTTQATIYEVKNAKGVEIYQFFLFNNNAAGQTFSIYIKRKGGTARRVTSGAALAQFGEHRPLETAAPLHLAAGDSIEGITTTTDAMDFVITGKELV